MPILKVFATRDEAAALLKQTTLIEPYDAFVVVDATPRAAQEIGRRFPVEDITAQFRLEQESKDFGRSWTDSMCLLGPGSSGEVCYKRDR